MPETEAAKQASTHADEVAGEQEASLTRQLLQQTQQELTETKERYLRTLADLANLKKRMTQENKEAWQRSAVTVVQELLPILDNFERALAAIEETTDFATLREGVELIYNQLQMSLQRLGVEPIAALGQQFDPFWHEAAGQVPTDEYEEGSVVNEIQRGYRIGDRVVRPSRVAVASPAGNAALETSRE